MALVMIKADLAVESTQVSAVEQSGSDVVITLALPATSKEATATDMDVDDVLEKLERA